MKAGKEALIKQATAVAIDLVGACGLASTYAYLSDAWEAVKVGWFFDNTVVFNHSSRSSQSYTDR